MAGRNESEMPQDTYVKKNPYERLEKLHIKCWTAADLANRYGIDLIYRTRQRQGVGKR